VFACPYPSFPRSRPVSSSALLAGIPNIDKKTVLEDDQPFLHQQDDTAKAAA